MTEQTMPWPALPNLGDLSKLCGITDRDPKDSELLDYCISILPTLPIEEISLDKLYVQSLMPTDVSEHSPTLYALAKQCKHITEMGTRTGVTTSAILYAQPETLIAYDLLRFPHIDRLEALAGKTKFKFIQGDSLIEDIEETDFLFIDTLHTYTQLTLELQKHSPMVRKYIALHDTETFGMHGEMPRSGGLVRAIIEFIKEKTFKLEKHYINNNGLTVLKRIEDGASPLSSSTN